MSLTLLAVVVAANAPAPMTSSPPQSSKEQVFPLQDLPHHKADSKKLEKLLRAATSDRLHWPRPLLKLLHHPCVRAWLPPPLKPQEIDIVVSGGGLKGYFLVGARHALTSHPGLVVRRYSGTSAGAWSAMFMAIDFPNADWFATYTLTQELGRRYLSQGKPTPQLLEAYREHMWPWMNSVLPADAHKRCSGKLFVTVTKVENMKLIPKVISKFDSNKELFEACVASSSLPGVTQKGVGSSFKDQKYFDGLFSDNVPVFVDDARPQLVFDLGKIQYALTAMETAATEARDRAALMSSTSNAHAEFQGMQSALAEALAFVVREKPDDPIDAIGRRLLSRSSKAESSPLDDEEARKLEKPIVSGETAVALALDLYGLEVVPGSLKDLDSYDDRNFYFRGTKAREELALPADAHAVEGADGTFHFVLKVHNGVESLEPGFIEAQNQAMAALREAGVWCPRALPSRDGALIAFAPLPLSSGVVRNHAIRCLPFKPAGLMGGVVATTGLLRDVGVITAKVSKALASFEHPATHRTFMWDLAQTLAVRPLLTHLSSERRTLIGSVLDEFETLVLPSVPKLRTTVIHGDINDQNVLVGPAGAADGERCVVGVIDFGDMCHTWMVNEIAIAAAYAVIALHYDRPEGAPSVDEMPSLGEVPAAVAIVSAYASQMEAQGMALSEAEWSVLPTLIACRIAMSLCIGAYSSAKDPTNEYLKLTLLPGLTALQRLRATPVDELLVALKSGSTP